MEERVESWAKETAGKELLEVMDTPERSKNSQIAASVSKFEDSPVFTFLNSLSPIKQVKSTHITQTINPLSFASIPSVFTSPHVSSLRESRFLRRHQLSDPSKPEFSSDDGIKIDMNMANSNATNERDEQKESAADEGAAETSYDCSKYVVDFARDYECASPNSNLRPGCGLETKGMEDYACSSLALVPFVQETSRRDEVNMDAVALIDQNKEATSCDWERLMSDASDLLVFESPDDRDSYKNSVDPGTSFYTSMQSDTHSMQLICALDPGEQVAGDEAENLSTQPGEGDDMDNAGSSDVNADPSLSNPDEKVDCEHLGFYRGMRRRCLIFEMGGARRKHLEQNPDSDSSVWLHSDGNSPSNDQKLVSINKGNESSRCLLPGIGLHLNALAMTPKDSKIVNPDSSASARLLIGPSSVVNLHPSTTGQQLLENILPVASSDKQNDDMENAVLPVTDACLPSGYPANEEISQGSPKKKRRRSEQAGEGESCKRCNCKRSKCLKLYCECFAAGVYCVEPCACIDCFNKPIHEDTVLATRKQIESRNPLAFAPKVIRGSDSPLEIGADDSSKTPASARHKRGCNCKKSGCLKKYCECYQGGVGCSVNCRCEGCKNAFGRKDGMEVEAEENETDAAEKSMPDKSAIDNDTGHNTDSVPPATPLRGGRPSAQLPFSSKKKPPRSSFPSSTSSSFVPKQGFGKSGFFPPPPKFDNHFETIREDEIPNFLQGGSPDGGIKSSSPNQKRVSPLRPHNGGAVSPGLRSSRKLILQSIPSFPSLAPNQ